MKKILIRLLLALLVLVILSIVAMSLFLDGAIKRGVETVGPMLTKVEIKLDSVSLSLLSGAGKIKNLVVGNPAGFKTPSAIQVGNASLVLKPGSVLSDKIIVKSVNIQAPEITYETDLRGSNLKRILANLDEATGGQQKTNAPANEAKASRKFQVDDFAITGGKIHLNVNALGNSYSTTLPLPDIHLTDLGQGPEGITAADLTKKVFLAIEQQAALMAATAATDVTKGAAGLTKDVGLSATNAVENLGKGLGGFLKKK